LEGIKEILGEERIDWLVPYPFGVVCQVPMNLTNNPKGK